MATPTSSSARMKSSPGIRRSPRTDTALPFRFASRLTRSAALASWIVVVAPVSGSYEEPTLSTGRWTVESTGFGWPTRLDSLEIRSTSRHGEAELSAYERVGDVRRIWGTSKVDRRGSGPATMWRLKC